LLAKHFYKYETKEEKSMKQITDKDDIEVFAQGINCSTQQNPYGEIMWCDRDCEDANKPPAYASDRW